MNVLGLNSRLCVHRLLSVLAVVALAANTTAAESIPSGFQSSPLGRFLLQAAEGLYIVERDGTCSWSYTFAFPQRQTLTQFDDLIGDACVLPSGNILYAANRYVREIDRQKRTVWEYRVSGTAEVKSCVPLAGNRVAILNSEEQAILELGRGSDRILKRIPFPAEGTNHTRYNLLRATPEGNYLLALRTENRFVEVTPEGKTVMSYPVTSLPVVAQRLSDGTTLCSARIEVTSFDRVGKRLWSYTRKDAEPDFPMIIAAGAVELPGGRLVVANSDWHYKEPDGNRVQLFMLNSQHKLAWTLPASALAGWKQSWTEPKTGLIEHRCMVIQQLD